MRGSIQKKGKVYYAVIAFGPKRKWFKGKGGTKKAAQKKLTDILKEIDDDTYEEIPETTFSEFADLWLKNYAEVHVKPATLVGYKNIVERLLKPVFGESLLTTIKTGKLQAYVADRLQKVSPKTVINEIVVIKLMFKHAHRWSYLKQNPADLVERPKTTKSEIEILNPDEVEILLNNASGNYRVAFLTVVMTGFRAGELWGLQWGDVDWNSKQIHVRRSLWKGKFQAPKSKYSIRNVDIPDMLVSELKKWRLACPSNDHDVIFPSPEGSLSQHDNVIKRHFNSALRRAKLRHVSFHSLRHTNASIRIHAGQNIKYLSTQLGHSSIKITLDIYGHLFNDEGFNRQQADLLEASFSAVRKPLEEAPKTIKKDLENVSKSLIINGSGDRI